MCSFSLRVGSLPADVLIFGIFPVNAVFCGGAAVDVDMFVCFCICVCEHPFYLVIWYDCC